MDSVELLIFVVFFALSILLLLVFNASQRGKDANDVVGLAGIKRGRAIRIVSVIFILMAGVFAVLALRTLIL